MSGKIIGNVNKPGVLVCVLISGLCGCAKHRTDSPGTPPLSKKQSACLGRVFDAQQHNIQNLLDQEMKAMQNSESYIPEIVASRREDERECLAEVNCFGFKEPIRSMSFESCLSDADGDQE